MKVIKCNRCVRFLCNRCVCRTGSRAGYSVLNGVFLTLVCLTGTHGCPPFCWKAHECWLVGCPVEVCKKFGDCLYKIIVTVCVRAGQVYLNAF